MFLVEFAEKGQGALLALGAPGQADVAAVDTHVFRVSKRLGLASQKAHTPREVENQLMQYIPLDLVPKAHHWLILHGRYICVARRPRCEECPLTSFCAFYQKHYPNLPDDPENKL